MQSFDTNYDLQRTRQQQTSNAFKPYHFYFIFLDLYIAYGGSPFNN